MMNPVGNYQNSPLAPSNGRSSFSSGESREILFEDVFGAGDGGDSFAWGQEPESPEQEPEVEKKPPPLEDQDLENANLLLLPKDEFIWAVGRAATLRLTQSKVWKDLPHAIHAFGGPLEFTPSEVCRLLQALAYAPADAPMEKKTFTTPLSKCLHCERKNFQMNG